MNKVHTLLLGTALVLSGCAVPTPRPPVQPPVTPPVLEKTFGEMTMDSSGALHVQYKNMKIVVDPSASTAWNADEVDYVLFTVAPRRAIVARKNIKIMAPPSAVAALGQQGFTQVKGVSTGQRLYLKKDETFLFASAVTNHDNNSTTNGYLLEFDNGRNVFISDRVTSLESLREFVFSLRDDGREVHAAIMSADDMALAAQAIALLQARFSFYEAAASSARQKMMQQLLSEQLYEGVFSFLKRGQSISF